jgi:hypothetical protein
MVSLTHCADNGWFNVHENGVYIGHIWCRCDNKWVFEADMNSIPECVLSDVKAILNTLNL